MSSSISAPHRNASQGVTLPLYLAECRELVLHEIREIVPKDERYRSVLYDLVLDYPLREAKALRPALCIATCRALGGHLEAVLRSAAVLELYHNAFLIHDDVEDGSESRRDRPTLHDLHGMPVAVNVGDAMLALTLQPLLDNMRLIGLGKALHILSTVARMARESAEGQALELHWIRRRDWQLSDTDYLRMVYKKTSWYTFITPVLLGGIVAGADTGQLAQLRKFAASLGIAFQIQDDVLNLTAEGGTYGKEHAGDLWEGKRTLILLHALRSCSEVERQRAIAILSKQRPRSGGAADDRLLQLIAGLQLDQTVRAQLELAIRQPGEVKSDADIHFLLHLIERHRSLDYARAVARRFAARPRQILAQATWLGDSVHRQFLHGLVDFVLSRDH